MASPRSHHKPGSLSYSGLISPTLLHLHPWLDLLHSQHGLASSGNFPDYIGLPRWHIPTTQSPRFSPFSLATTVRPKWEPPGWPPPFLPSTAAGTPCQRCKSDHTTPLRESLPGLLGSLRIQCLHELAPLTSSRLPRLAHPLLITSVLLPFFDGAKSFPCRALAHAVSSLWNVLPTTLCLVKPCPPVSSHVNVTVWRKLSPPDPQADSTV